MLSIYQIIKKLNWTIFSISLLTNFSRFHPKSSTSFFFSWIPYLSRFTTSSTRICTLTQPSVKVNSMQIFSRVHTGKKSFHKSLSSEPPARSATGWLVIPRKVRVLNLATCPVLSEGCQRQQPELLLTFTTARHCRVESCLLQNQQKRRRTTNHPGVFKTKT